MELRQLRSLVAVADLRAIAKAAEKLCLTGPAIHKQLKMLQSELGVRLYEKEGRALRLTPAAEILLPHFRETLAQLDSAADAVAEWKGLKRGLVRIGAGPATSAYALPQLLKRYWIAFPEVDLFVESGNSLALLEKLENGRLDLAALVSSHIPERPSVIVETSLDMEFVLVGVPSKAPRYGSMPGLTDFPFVLFGKGSRTDTLIDRYFAALDFHPRVHMRFDNAEAVKARVQAGLGISILPLWIVYGDVKNKSLFIIRQKDEPLFSKLDLVRRKSGFVAPAVAAFIEMVRVFKFRNPPLLRTRSKLNHGRGLRPQ